MIPQRVLKILQSCQKQLGIFRQTRSPVARRLMLTLRAPRRQPITDRTLAHLGNQLVQCPGLRVVLTGLGAEPGEGIEINHLKILSAAADLRIG